MQRKNFQLRETVEIVAKDGHFVVPIDLSFKTKDGALVSERFEFLLDTGASRCVIPIAMARVYGIERMRDEKGKIVSERVTTANGTVELELVKFEKIRVSNTDLEARKQVESWLGNDFILGMNFLSQFRVRMEYGRKLMIED